MAAILDSEQNDFSYFDLLVTPMLPFKFQDNQTFVSEEDTNNRFPRWRQWRPSCISHRNNFSYYYLQVTPMLPTKFHVNWPFISEEEAKNRFSRWWPWRISDCNNFSYFCSKRHPDASYQVSSQLVFWFRRRR